jgi:hypothetical protein
MKTESALYIYIYWKALKNSKGKQFFGGSEETI